MAKAKSKEPIRLARDIFDEFPSKADPEAVAANPPPIELHNTKQTGRKGGLKGGPTRAANLTPKKRRQIAKKASSTRWQKKG